MANGETLGVAHKELGDVVGNQAARFQEWLKEHGPGIASLLAAIQEIPSRSRAAMLTMAQHGWYLHSEMRLEESLSIGERLSRGELAEVEAELCKSVDAMLDGITEGILKNHAHRTGPIRAAIEAHRRGEYYLSTPVLLAQADGLTQERLGKQLYAKNAGVPKIQALYREDERAFLAPLIESTPLTANEQERQGKRILLNRHAILHGESCEYGTREVSCRAVAFLSFVALSFARQDSDSAAQGSA